MTKLLAILTTCHFDRLSSRPLVISTQGEILCAGALQDSSYRRNGKVDGRNDKVDDHNDISLENMS